ncbi:MAG: TIGR02186 family protein, partial [Dongiaceae bacterium]
MAWALAGGAARAQEPLVADLTEYRIAITTGFVGTDVYVFGAKSGPGDVVVIVRGPTVPYAVRRKDRIAGIWLNARRIDFRGVPSFYVIASTRPLDELMSSVGQLREEIGLGNLNLMPEEDVDAAEVAEFRTALLRIKQSAGLFGRAATKVTV